METIKYLDYEIKNSGNSDGWVITKPFNTQRNNLWECNLGNFNDLMVAKKYATLHFLTARPETFANNIVNRMLNGKGLHHEWHSLVRVLETENIIVPEELTMSDDMNLSIWFNGKPLNYNDDTEKDKALPNDFICDGMLYRKYFDGLFHIYNVGVVFDKINSIGYCTIDKAKELFDSKFKKQIFYCANETNKKL